MSCYSDYLYIYVPRTFAAYKQLVLMLRIARFFPMPEVLVEKIKSGWLLRESFTSQIELGVLLIVIGTMQVGYG